MAEIHQALRNVALGEDPTRRAVNLAGLLSTCFQTRGVELVVVGELAYSSYADRASRPAELELASLSGNLTPRLLQEIMGGELRAEGGVDRWTLIGVPIRFYFQSSLALRNLCRNLETDYGTVKLRPAEEITAERVLAAVFPSENPLARGEALTILTQALVDAFEMDWIALRDLCHQPDYRIGEELIQLRTEAKRDMDALGLGRDQIGAVWSRSKSSEPDHEVFEVAAT